MVSRDQADWVLLLFLGFDFLWLQKLIAPQIFCNYNNCMEITFDPTKDTANQAKHGVSLLLARELDWSDVMAKPDTRRDYGELREIGYGVIDNRLYCVVFTQRQDTMHVISLRKANSREVKNYVDN